MGVIDLLLLGLNFLLELGTPFFGEFFAELNDVVEVGLLGSVFLLLFLEGLELLGENCEWVLVGDLGLLVLLSVELERLLLGLLCEKLVLWLLLLRLAEERLLRLL